MRVYKNTEQIEKINLPDILKPITFAPRKTEN